ncbi:MAG TPA: c-type cytochrome [Gaiellaceae bacterium]|nr:c-type cytochrome [Gaiellaceae bacterium]
MRLRGLLGACAVLLAALAATGCGSGGLTDAGDAARGKELFAGEGRCGTCHVLADAGTKGVIGPNLDNAFLQSREDGLGEGTIRAVVRDQIAYPIETPNTGSPGMPADLVTGDDADAVAAYVASVAGLPVRASGGSGTETGGGTTTGGGPEEQGGETADGEAIFAEAGCGGCHALEAANASGSVGPSLDDSKPSKELVVDRVTNGQGAMPAFKDSYTPEQIDAVADYVVASTSG